MNMIRAVILTVCTATLGSMAVVAQTNNASFPAGSANPSNRGTDNSAFGFNALHSNGSGTDDTATGFGALANNTSGPNNTATGFEALTNNTIGSDNTATGAEALFVNSTGSLNTAVGFFALSSNNSGGDNTGIGSASLYFNTLGNKNTAVGEFALVDNTTGSNNIGVGQGAGLEVTSGSYNIEIGNFGTSSDTGVTRIGTSGQQTSFFAAGINGVQVSGVPVYIDGNGQLGTINSSIRFKEDVHDMGDASSRIFLLRPVTYRYKQPYDDGSKPIDYGLIAEEVAKVYPDMVVKGADGQIQTVQYQKLTPMLLNELQKQHQVIAEQGEAIQLLEKRLAALESAQSASSPASQHAAE